MQPRFTQAIAMLTLAEKLKEIETVWELVEAYYPDYSTSPKIARANDLQIIMDGEVENEPESSAYKIWMDEFNGNTDMTDVENEYNCLHVHIYTTCIEAMLKEIQTSLCPETDLPY